MPRTRIAFFDVDGTLTTATTLFRFLRYHLAAHGHAPHEYEERRRALKAMTEVGVPREETNRAYFRNFTGAEAHDVARLGRNWFAGELSDGSFFHTDALAALQRHRAEADRVVLVSGSFPACLAPIADHLGADRVCCTEPEIVDGRYTGDILREPMIGSHKAAAVRRTAEAWGVRPEDCVAYGDHVSDLPMLSATGTAVVVGGDEGMRLQARSRGWRLLAQSA